MKRSKYSESQVVYALQQTETGTPLAGILPNTQNTAFELLDITDTP